MSLNKLIFILFLLGANMHFASEKHLSFSTDVWRIVNNASATALSSAGNSSVELNIDNKFLIFALFFGCLNVADKSISIVSVSGFSEFVGEVSFLLEKSIKELTQ